MHSLQKLLLLCLIFPIAEARSHSERLSSVSVPSPVPVPFNQVPKKREILRGTISSDYVACTLSFRSLSPEARQINESLKAQGFSLVTIDSGALKDGALGKLCWEIENEAAYNAQKKAPYCDTLLIDADFDTRFFNASRTSEREPTLGLFEVQAAVCRDSCPNLFSELSTLFVVGANTPLTINKKIAKKSFQENLRTRGYLTPAIETLWIARKQAERKKRDFKGLIRSVFGNNVDTFGLDLSLSAKDEKLAKLKLERFLYSKEIKSLKKRIDVKREKKVDQRINKLVKTDLENVLKELTQSAFEYCEETDASWQKKSTWCSQRFKKSRPLKTIDELSDPLVLEEEIEHLRYFRSKADVDALDKRKSLLTEAIIANRDNLPRSMRIYGEMALSSVFYGFNPHFQADLYTSYYEELELKKLLEGSPPSLKDAEEWCKLHSSRRLDSKSFQNLEWYETVGGVLLMACIAERSDMWTEHKLRVLRMPLEDRLVLLQYALDKPNNNYNDIPKGVDLTSILGCTFSSLAVTGLQSSDADERELSSAALLKMGRKAVRCVDSQEETKISDFLKNLLLSPVTPPRQQGLAFEAIDDMAQNGRNVNWSELYSLAKMTHNHYAAITVPLGPPLDLKDMRLLVADFRKDDVSSDEWLLAAKFVAAAAEDIYRKDTLKKAGLKKSDILDRLKKGPSAKGLRYLLSTAIDLDLSETSLLKSYTDRKLTIRNLLGDENEEKTFLLDIARRSGALDKMIDQVLASVSSRDLQDDQIADLYFAIFESTLLSDYDHKRFFSRVKKLLSTKDSERVTLHARLLAEAFQRLSEVDEKKFKKFISGKLGAEFLQKVSSLPKEDISDLFPLWANGPLMNTEDYWLTFGRYHLEQLCFGEFDEEDPVVNKMIKALKKIKFTSDELLANHLAVGIQDLFFGGTSNERNIDLTLLKKAAPNVAKHLCSKLRNSSIANRLENSGCEFD